MYKCAECAKIYSTIGPLTNHRKRLCNKKPNLSCKHCDYKTLYRPNLDRHTQTRHMPRVPNLNKCKKCRKCYSCPQTLKKHIIVCGRPEKVKTLSKRFTCDLCDYKTHNKTLLCAHIQRQHLPRDFDANKCDNCGKSYTDASGLKRHSQFCGKPKKNLSYVYCDHCDYKATRKQNLASHIRFIHSSSPGGNEFQCEYCEKILRLSSKYSHLQICGPLKEKLVCLSCDHCQFKTYSKNSLAVHIEGRHTLWGVNLNKCKKCGKNFSRKGTLKSHLKLCGKSEEFKRSLMPYSCDHCEFKAKSKIDISQHLMSKHFRNPDNKCPKCKKLFLHVKSMKYHLRLCGKSKEYKRSLMRFSCDHCEHKTFTKTDMSIHIQTIHLRQNPKSARCKSCGKDFCTRTYLRKHSKLCGRINNMKQSSQFRRFSCDHCTYKCLGMTRLVRHMQLKHLVLRINIVKCTDYKKSVLLEI